MSMECTIREVLELLGIESVDVPAEADILKGRRYVVEILHKLTVALILGSHFDSRMSFSKDIDAVKLDDEKLRVIIESISGETKCSTHDALNILTYITLEYLRYPRLGKITLDILQDSRELFLALVFLLSRQKWFDKMERMCPEYLNFRKCLTNAVIQQVDDLNPAKQANTIVPESTIRQLTQLWGKCKCASAADDSTKNAQSSNPSGTPGILPDRRPQMGNRDLSVHFLQTSGRYGIRQSSVEHPSRTSNKGKEQYLTSECTAESSSVYTSQKIVILFIGNKNGGKHSRGGNTFQKEADSINAEDTFDTSTSGLLSDIEDAVAHTTEEIKAKAQLLCRCKNAETFDSELIRVIIGQGQQQVLFNNLMDNIDSSNDEQATNKVHSKMHFVQRGRTAQSMGKSADGQTESENQIQALVNEIIKLSHTIMQMQYRLKHLTESVEQGDKERLKHFTHLSENRKMYDKAPINKPQEIDGNGSTFMDDRYGMPNPAEWVMIAQKEPFERHLALLKMILKALENETNRSSTFETALDVLKHIKPDALKKRPNVPATNPSRCSNPESTANYVQTSTSH
ncbi:uncharacterized protein BXIN_1142 [Babesia sp. Xinjiang]|uniref:uncharacterized protein n=1 Tax=Babesia sp. Xinjiang TaxID=462227 RepID=UPI000A25BBAF|nr:uncharacterized protein BXIN_1142 [Babesia sp. Xinjiang]ORM42363.1 hypothetical protein BXIN_1142 [Babesia sp. Xinjiang]